MFPNGPAMVRDLDLMLKAASAALTQWRFAAPAAAPAIARVPAQFDSSAGQATAGRVEAISGFAGTAGAHMSTFVARRDRHRTTMAPSASAASSSLR